MVEIKYIKDLLKMNLCIPNYQRPYKWTHKNITDLLFDIDNAIIDAEKYQKFRYRIGTIILNNIIENNSISYDIVDGQQRIISLLLIQLFLDNNFNCKLLSENFSNKISQSNINSNYRFIKDWFVLKNNEYKKKVNSALDEILEVVIIYVDKQAEAFQLFDSQNTRGKALDPHDLLKAYHLREMKEYPYEMKHAVTKWEAVNTKDIKELFELYLFPIQNWIICKKSFNFTVKDIDIYKGISENSIYTYAKRANKAMPYFQLSEPFISGNDFFQMVEYYLNILNDLKIELSSNSNFLVLNNILNCKYNNSTGFHYAKNLFYCVILCYYDRFRNFDEQVVKKLFSWAFMLRVDMTNLGFESVNKYAIGDLNPSYTNTIPMFSRIKAARLHNEIKNIQINTVRKDGKAGAEKWNLLYKSLKNLNGEV